MPFDAKAAAQRLTDIGAQPTRADLSGIESGFLSALEIAERMGIGNTALKLYNDVVARGRRSPITERDFTPGNLEGLRQVVAAASQRQGPKGTALPYDYQTVMLDGGDTDYNMIGGFQYETAPDGSVTIRDTYDFNLDRADKPGVEGEGSAFQFMTQPIGFAASIGRKRVPDNSGGVPVQIMLAPRR